MFNPNYVNADQSDRDEGYKITDLNYPNCIQEDGHYKACFNQVRAYIESNIDSIKSFYKTKFGTHRNAREINQVLFLDNNTSRNPDDFDFGYISTCVGLGSDGVVNQCNRGTFIGTSFYDYDIPTLN